MSYSSGPCPNCGEPTMYDDREPTPCPSCRRGKNTTERARAVDVANLLAAKIGNRKTRRAARKGK